MVWLCSCCGRLLYACRITDSVIGDTVETDLTVEELGAIIRRERSSGSLSEVRHDLYPAMMRLLEKQSRECERQIGIDIGSLASAAANERRKKIQQSIKLVVELRMSKVAALAIRTAMGSINSIENLPKEEREYHERVLGASELHWQYTERRKKNVVLMDIETVSKPVPEPVVKAVPVVEAPVKAAEAGSLSEMPIIPDDEMEMDMGDIDFPDDFSEFPDSEVVPEVAPEVVPESVPADVPATESVEPEEVVAEPEPEIVDEVAPEIVPELPAKPVEETPVTAEDFDDNSLLTIHVTEDIPEFVGPTRDYLLRKGDVIRMPAGMATVLINRKMATKLF